MAESSSKEALIARMAASRAIMSYKLAGIKENVALGDNLRRSVKNNTAVWVGGAMILGFLISRIPRRRAPRTEIPASKSKVVKETASKQSVRTALLLGGLKIVIDLAKPAVLAAIKTHVGNRFYSVPQSRGATPNR